MKKILSLLLTVFCLSGCFGPKGLVGSEYVMIYDNADFYPISIGFRDDNTFYSNTVNKIEGIYNLNNNQLTMQVNDKTNVVPDISFVGIEDNWQRTLPKISSYSLTDNGIQLITYDNQVYDFTYAGRAQ